MPAYYRAIPLNDPAANDYPRIAGGWVPFRDVEVLERDRPAKIVPWREIPADMLARITAPRADIAGLTMSAPRLMGIVNTTPDSFSDGGRHFAADDAVASALSMVSAGADILDIGGESTRPGADFVPAAEEIRRTRPVIAAIRERDPATPISIDTRKADVARAALDAGATMLNDVSALGYDSAMGDLAANSAAPICLMHALADPKTMQNRPEYDDVLLDIYDYLSGRIDMALAAGIRRDQVVVDPGIGFGKTLEHNLALLRRLSLFHSLGCPVLLGTSRKRFIGTLSGVEQAERRFAGSVTTALHGLAHGVQIIRVHDIAETKQALCVWNALSGNVE